MPVDFNRLRTYNYLILIFISKADKTIGFRNPPHCGGRLSRTVTGRRVAAEISRTILIS